MIWFDIATKEPVAPGSCEDGGFPSITFYDCDVCERVRPLAYDQQFKTFAVCAVCHTPLIASM